MNPNPSARRLCLISALLLAMATGIGALGAHALKGRLGADQLAVLQTAVQYQFFHSLGLLGIGLLVERLPGRALVLSGWMVLAGVVLFCGSLYALLAGAPRWFGVLTPLGGLSLIAGWCLCALGLLRQSD
jgi:uncharacterized membrane protein YgdD (TMEM256/DUF423 family)